MAQGTQHRTGLRRRASAERGDCHWLSGPPLLREESAALELAVLEEQRAVLSAEAAEDLDLDAPAEAALPVNLKSARELADRRAIRQALARTENNISGAAKLLGISRPTLYDLLKQYRLQA